jgi:ParB/RepB/Spo0J family partition protein
MNAPEPRLRDVPTGLITPSPTNPRKRHQNGAENLKRWNLQELADNIVSTGGVIEPVIMRTNPAWAEGNGLPRWELIAGERRWRATQLAGLPTVPALVRELNDFALLLLQISENVHSEPLNAIEEAEHFRRMLDAPNGCRDVDELATKLGKSRRAIYNRLDLLKLSPEVRQACFAEEITASVALEIANGVPDHADQVKALADAKRGWNGESYSARAMRAHIGKTFNLRLDQARFDPTATYLKPDTTEPWGPACGECPKRAGANPDFFDDVKEGDRCQDAACFQGKTAAARQQLLDAAKAEGAMVVSGDAAKRMLPGGTGKPAGFQLLDQPCIAFTDHPKALRLVAGDAIKSHDFVVIDVPGSAAPVIAVTDTVAKRALKAKGVLKITEPAAAPKKAAKPAAPKHHVSDAGARVVEPPKSDATDTLLEKLLAADVLDRGTAMPSKAVLDVKTKAASQRAQALLAAHAVSRRMRTDGAEGLPGLGLEHVVLVLTLWGETIVPFAEACRLALIEPPKGGDTRLAKTIEWAWSLDSEDAARLALVLLALQSDLGDSAPGNYGRFHRALLRSIDLEFDALAADAAQRVREQLQVELLKRGKPVAKTAKKATATVPAKKAIAAKKPAAKKVAK